MPHGPKFDPRNLFALSSAVVLAEDADMERAGKILENMAGLGAKFVERAFVEIEKRIAPIAGAYLVENYRNGPLRVKTGKLIGALAKPMVHFKSSRLGLVMNVRMAPNVPKYKNQKRTQFYNAAGALQYGAVHGSAMGRRAKLTYKKKQYNVNEANAEIRDYNDALRRRQASGLDKRKKPKKYKIAKNAITGAEVTPAYNYMRLTQGQIKNLANFAMTNLVSLIEDFIENRRKHF